MHVKKLHDGKIAIKATVKPVNQLHPDQEFYTTDVFTDWALKYIDEADTAQKPLFMYVAYNEPHWPAGAPRSPKAFTYGAPPQTPTKGTSTLDNPNASRCAPALNFNLISA